jgi:hypothetical protein
VVRNEWTLFEEFIYDIREEASQDILPKKSAEQKWT